MTRTERERNIVDSYLALEDAIGAAQRTERDYGASDPRTLRAWEIVEAHGATIHRQSRLMAGKSKGG